MTLAEYRRRRSAKPASVHSLAQSGDMTNLKMKLEENPSLLNSRNSVMLQTPLHLAAGSNQTVIVKFLLQQDEPEKVNLEAKNLYGETPLHLAAKNGCEQCTKLLLDYGAFLEAKADNGMTPLHLAVWHAVQTQVCDAVNIFLEYNADCSAVDNEGMTPINHLAEDAASEKLRGLLKMHMAKQKMHKAMECYDEAKKIMAGIEAEISKIVGLKELKFQLNIWAKGMLLDARRRSLGLSINSRRPPHMAFLGNAGTGKTMVARVLGKLLHMVGVLPTNKVIEVQRTDLVGEFVGHTGPKTRRKILEAEGGILFVDEAYRLIPMQKSDDKDYGIEALEEIMSCMDGGKVVVIFAGYPEAMSRVISSNPGFCRRVTKFFYFDDFTTHELAEILHIKMREQRESSSLYGFKLHQSCSVEAVAELIERRTTDEQRSAKNGGVIDRLLETARDNLDNRLDWDCMNAEDLVTLTLEDLELGLLKC